MQKLGRAEKFYNPMNRILWFVLTLHVVSEDVCIELEAALELGGGTYKKGVVCHGFFGSFQVKVDWVRFVIIQSSVSVFVHICTQ